MAPLWQTMAESYGVRPEEWHYRVYSESKSIEKQRNLLTIFSNKPFITLFILGTYLISVSWNGPRTIQLVYFMKIIKNIKWYRLLTVYILQSGPSRKTTLNSSASSIILKPWLQAALTRSSMAPINSRLFKRQNTQDFIESTCLDHEKTKNKTATFKQTTNFHHQTPRFSCDPASIQPFVYVPMSIRRSRMYSIKTQTMH